MTSTLYLQALCLTTTPCGSLLGALTAEEIDNPAYLMDTVWFEDFQKDLVLVQRVWPQLLRPAPPRAIICDNCLAAANAVGMNVLF